MYILVVGGGKIGYHLVRTLLSEGHEVSVIEKDLRVCEQIADHFDVMVQIGDGSSTRLLTEAGCNRADCVVSVAGRDQDNLVVCQIAKELFKVPRTIARINDPRNEDLFRAMGVDALVSVTAAVATMIDQEINPRSVVHYLTMQHGHLIMVEATLFEDSPAVGKAIATLTLPSETIIVSILREGAVRVPTGATVLMAGDEIIAVTRAGHQTEVKQHLIGEKTPASPGAK